MKKHIFSMKPLTQAYYGSLPEGARLEVELGLISVIVRDSMCGNALPPEGWNRCIMKTVSEPVEDVPYLFAAGPGALKEGWWSMGRFRFDITHCIEAGPRMENIVTIAARMKTYGVIPKPYGVDYGSRNQTENDYPWAKPYIEEWEDGSLLQTFYPIGDTYYDIHEPETACHGYDLLLKCRAQTIQHYAFPPRQHSFAISFNLVPSVAPPPPIPSEQRIGIREL